MKNKILIKIFLHQCISYNIKYTFPIRHATFKRKIDTGCFEMLYKQKNLIQNSMLFQFTKT